MPHRKLALDARYLSKILDHAQSQEVFVLCSFWEPVGACGLQTRIDGIPHEDHSDTELVSVEECEKIACYSGTYEILQKVYPKLCPDHHVDGKIVEEECHVVLE